MSDPADDMALPPVGRARPKKAPNAFRTISEVADELHIPQHVLRFWETKFPQVKPLKRGGGRRYYRPGRHRAAAPDFRSACTSRAIRSRACSGCCARAAAGCRTTSRRAPATSRQAAEAERAGRASIEPELPMPGLAARPACVGECAGECAAKAGPRDRASARVADRDPARTGGAAGAAAVSGVAAVARRW